MVIAIEAGGRGSYVYANSVERVFTILTDCAEADLLMVDDTMSSLRIDWWVPLGEDPVKEAKLDEIRAKYPGEGHYLPDIL